jgi:hypothetical protein
MVALVDGQFRVDFGPVPIERGNITMSLPSLLMESARQQDELARVRNALPPWDAKLRCSAKVPTMSRDEHQLALRCDGTRTIAEIVDGAPNALEAATMLRDLVERGALVVARPPSVVVTLSRRSSRETSGLIVVPDAVQPRPQRETTQPRPSLPRRAGLQTLGALLGVGTLASAIAFVAPTSETTAAPRSSESTPVLITSPAPVCPAGGASATPELCADRELVTVSAYRACVRDEHCSPANAKIAAVRIRDGRRQGLDVRCTADLDGREHDPVNCVTQAQAIEYCEWVGKRLPTDVESYDAARVVDVRESLAEWTSSSVSVEDPSSVSVSGGTRGYAGRVANAEQGDFAIGFRCVASPEVSL